MRKGEVKMLESREVVVMVVVVDMIGLGSLEGNHEWAEVRIDLPASFHVLDIYTTVCFISLQDYT